MSTPVNEDLYGEFLDEVYGPIEICGLEYSTSQALRVIDPTAYREGFLDWQDENMCATEDCENDPNDGEGYDGYCGDCADRIAELEELELEEREAQK